MSVTLGACTAQQAAGKVINVATGQRYTLNQVVATLNQIIGTPSEQIYAPPRAGDIRHSLADTSLARELLGYSPTVSLEEELQKTVEWYRQSWERLYGGGQ